jgi:arginine decarboxylase
MLIPKRLFLTNGVGKHKEKLQSFELALRDAGIQHCNLVQVSSIVPAGCKVIPKEKGRVLLTPGEVTFVMLARNATKEPNRLIAASVGLAIPSTKTYGYISEHHAFGQNEDTAGDYAEDLAATMLATTMGITFDSAKAWDQRKQLFKSSGLIIRTSNVAQTAEGDKNGLWTSVVAAAVLIP